MKYHENFIDVMSSNKVMNRLFVFLLYSSIVLPTGSLFGINVKMLSLFILLAAILFNRKDSFFINIFIRLAPIVLFLLVWCILSVTNMQYDITYLPSQVKDIFVFFLMFYVFSVYARYFCGYEYLMKKIITAVFIVGILKICILVLSVATGIPVSMIVKLVGDFFGTDIMTFDVELSSISRINFTSDSIIFICVFYLFMRLLNHDFRKMDYVILSVLCFSALVTMSRFQWATCTLSIFVALFLNLKRMKSFFVILMLFVVAIGSLSLGSVQEMINTRFDQRIVDSSDIERDIQKIEIYEKIESAPLFGNGVGYYIPTVIRSSAAKYSYELQIQALLMQFGVIGEAIIMLMIIVPLALVGRKMTLIAFAMFMSLCLIWISGALFNPVLFSSSAGAGMAALYSIGRCNIMPRKKLN